MFVAYICISSAPERLIFKSSVGGILVKIFNSKSLYLHLDPVKIKLNFASGIYFKQAFALYSWFS